MAIKPSQYRVGILPPPDRANLIGLPRLLREQFKIDRRGMNHIWAGVEVGVAKRAL